MPRPDSWLTKHEICRALDVLPVYFDRRIRPLALQQEVRRIGRRNIYKSRPVIQRFFLWWLEIHGRQSGNGTAVLALEGSPAPEASPALERFRAARANLVELEFDFRRQDLILRQDVREGFAVIAASLRRGLEELRRQHGNSALSIMAESLEQAERDLAEKFHP